MRKKQFLLGLMSGIIGVAVLLWVMQTRESRAATEFTAGDDSCVCSEPKPTFKDATKGQLLASKLVRCQCGSLDCVLALGSFGGLGGKGNNYGISCVK